MSLKPIGAVFATIAPALPSVDDRAVLAIRCPSCGAETGRSCRSVGDGGTHPAGHLARWTEATRAAVRAAA